MTWRTVPILAVAAASLGAGCFQKPDPTWVLCAEGKASACTPEVCASFPSEKRPTLCRGDVASDATSADLPVDVVDCWPLDGLCVVGTACDDNDPCTTADLCQADGSCKGSDVVCQDSPNPCAEYQCAPSTGSCEPVSLADGTPCDADGDGCTVGDSCSAGVCVPGFEPPCEDGLACTDDTCVSTAPGSYVCEHAFNGSGCFIGGDCYAHGEVSPDDPCAVCDEAGPGVWSAAPDGTLCDSVPNVCMDWTCVKPAPTVPVAAGTFWMGCNELSDPDCGPEEYPYHSVSVPSFEIAVIEVTNVAYRACVLAGGCTEHVKPEPEYDDPAFGHHPVIKVLWEQAGQYCAWAGQRLCTEAEWEYAARRHTGSRYPWGNELATCEYAVMDDPDAGGIGCGTGSMAEVGSKMAGKSPSHTLDMTGNVHEWVEDCWHETYDSAPPAGTAWVDDCHLGDNHHVFRGGSYGSPAVNVRTSARSETSGIGPGIRCCK